MTTRIIQATGQADCVEKDSEALLRSRKGIAMVLGRDVYVDALM